MNPDACASRALSTVILAGVPEGVTHHVTDEMSAVVLRIVVESVSTDFLDVLAAQLQQLVLVHDGGHRCPPPRLVSCRQGHYGRVPSEEALGVGAVFGGPAPSNRGLAIASGFSD